MQNAAFPAAAPNRKFFMNPLLLIGLIGTFTIGSHFIVDLVRVYHGDPNIWWTPRSMALPWGECADRFRIQLSGEPFQAVLTDGRLSAANAAGETYRVVAEDLRVRLNNWPSVKAGLLSRALWSAFFSGAMLACLIIGLIQAFSGRRKGKPPAN